MQDTAGEVRTNSQVTFSYGLLHMDTLVLADHQRLTSALSGGSARNDGRLVRMARERNIQFYYNA